MALTNSRTKVQPRIRQQYASNREIYVSYFIWASGEEWKSALFQHGCMHIKRCEKQPKHHQHCIRIHSIHKTNSTQHQSFLSSHTHALSLSLFLWPLIKGLEIESWIVKDGGKEWCLSDSSKRLLMCAAPLACPLWWDLFAFSAVWGEACICWEHPRRGHCKGYVCIVTH